MIKRIPLENRFVQSGQGDTLGNVWSSRNLDLEVNKGKVRPSESVIGVSNSLSSATQPQSTPQAFTKFLGTVDAVSTVRYWTTALEDFGTMRVFQTTKPWIAFELDEDSPIMSTDPADVDMRTFAGNLYVASDTDLDRRNATAWTSISSTLSTGRKLLSEYAGRLYIVDNDLTVISMNAAETITTSGQFTLDLDVNGNSQEQISSIRAVSNGLWIGTVHKRGGRGKMYFWDGDTADTVDASYRLSTAGVMAITIKDDRPYVIGMNGVMYTFNGTYFEEVARLDLDDRQLYNFDVSSNNNRFINPNGMINVREEILFAITTRTHDTTDTTPIKSPSGVYAYHPDYGIYHKHSLSSQDESTTQYDLGQVELKEVGAMWVLHEDDKLDSVDEQSDFMVGYSYAETNTTDRFAVGVHQKRGLQQDLINAAVFITPEYYSEQAREMWQKLYLRQRPMENATDKIVVKHRTQQYTAFEADITWVDTTSFTSTSVNFANVEVGYEFEGLQGDGAGYLAHVSSIEEAGGTYTVVLDETITGATTRTAKCRMDNWQRTGDISKDDQPYDVLEIPVGEVSGKIQYKIYMTGEIEMEEIISISDVGANFR